MGESNKSDYFSGQIEKSKQREAFYNQVVHELQTGENYQEYFKQFASGSVERFIAYYANLKVHWFEYSDILSRHASQQSRYYHTEAVSLLRSIQKKKAFNAIIRWGFGELDIPGAKSYYDFQDWLSLPFSCTYITPVQPHEVDAAIGFIHSLPVSYKLKHHTDFHAHVYNLAYVGTEYLNEDNYPLLCRYYDDTCGTPSIMHTVPPRIGKECRYVDAWRDYKRAQESAKEKEEKAGEKVRLSYIESDLTEALLKKHESPYVYSLFKAHKRFVAKMDFPWLPESELYFLLDAHEDVPVQANDDWREGLGDAAEIYKREQVAYELPFVYKEYFQKREDGSDFSDWQTDHGYMEKQGYDRHLAEILEGRKLLGEPADFNF